MGVQWFPILMSKRAPFLIDGSPSGALGSIATTTVVVDNYPHMLYGVRLAVTYEIPAALFGLIPDFKANMRQGGVDFDFDLTINTSQQSIALEPAHAENVQGAQGIMKLPFPVAYPVRGSNNITIEARRLSSYAQVRVDGIILDVAPTLKITLELARGVQSLAENVIGPPAPGSTGFPS